MVKRYHQEDCSVYEELKSGKTEVYYGDELVQTIL